MKEEWRDIKGYEGKYQISNLGRVKSLKDNHGNYREKILRPNKNRNGYLYVNFYKDNKKKIFYIHRLVGIYFISNFNNYSVINHKDENKQNNKVSNLEWCTHKYNINYGNSKDKISSSKKGIVRRDMEGSNNLNSRKVYCITTGKTFSTIKEASQYYNINRVCISKNCSGYIKYAGVHPITGERLIWKYKEDFKLCYSQN